MTAYLEKLGKLKKLLPAQDNETAAVEGVVQRLQLKSQMYQKMLWTLGNAKSEIGLVRLQAGAIPSGIGSDDSPLSRLQVASPFQLPPSSYQLSPPVSLLPSGSRWRFSQLRAGSGSVNASCREQRVCPHW